MTTEQSLSKSTRQKRQRRIKQDPEYIFENFITEPTASTSQTEPIHSVDEQQTDLYEPGDIVWSKLGSFPWWPALIYRCDAEGGIHTKTLKSNNKIKRQYFVYFYGKYLEYAWLSTRSLLNYSGLDNFIQNAELAVQQASTKSEQVQLANRYQLKVSMKKRIQWDESIELANRALKLTKDERIKEFHDLLNGDKQKPKTSIRRQYSETFDEQPIKKKRGRKPKSELKSSNNPIINLPPLSNFELKQIVEGLINHNQEKTLSFDDAQSFAINKAIEIVYENHNYQMTDISNEWFYDSILLKYPSVVFKYRSWFNHINPDIIPDGNDLIKLKQWQIALMIQAEEKSVLNK